QGQRKSLGSANHRTGHPRCVQFTENAVKFVSFSRRSQAAVRAVTPDHGRGDASSKVTLTVSPTLNWSTAPTARQVRGGLRVSGETRNPITGTPTTAAASVDNAIERRERKRRRAMTVPSSGVRGGLVGVASALAARSMRLSGQGGGVEWTTYPTIPSTGKRSEPLAISR